MKQLGINALLSIIISFTFIFWVFKLFQNLRLDIYINASKKNIFNLILILVSIAIGFMVSQFFLNFIENIENLKYIVY